MVIDTNLFYHKPHFLGYKLVTGKKYKIKKREKTFNENARPEWGSLYIEDKLIVGMLLREQEKISFFEDNIIE